MKREEVERRIARRIIDDALAAGYSIDLFDGEEVVLHKGTNADAIMAGMFSSDDDMLFLHKDGKRIGSVWLIYGNGGYDVVSDYSMSLHDLLQGAGQLAEQLEAEVDV
jgi:hypothetical protein